MTTVAGVIAGVQVVASFGCVNALVLGIVMLAGSRRAVGQQAVVGLAHILFVPERVRNASH
jgi:hypothetical protein